MQISEQIRAAGVVGAGAQVLGSKRLLVNKIVIPAPRKELLTEIV